MSHCNYTPSRRAMSMAELNHNKTLNARLETHLRSIAEETGDKRILGQAERVHFCSTFWQGFFCKSCGKYHYMHTTGCKHRLCPICATRAARVTAMQALEAINLIKQQSPDVNLSLLTLTQRNVNGPDLQNEISGLLRAWNAMCNQRTFRQTVFGYARTIEIVPALANDGTYHPHVHAILIHKKSIMPVGWFVDRWRNALHLAYDPICDIRPIDDDQGAVFEVSKYISKMTRVYDGSAREHDHVKYLLDATYNRRLRTYGGEWLKARRNLGQMPVENMDDDAISEYGDMTDVSGKCPTCGEATIAATLRWSGLRYVTIPEDIRVIPMGGSFLT